MMYGLISIRQEHAEKNELSAKSTSASVVTDIERVQLNTKIK